jgi:hypothetical protein
MPASSINLDGGIGLRHQEIRWSDEHNQKDAVELRVKYGIEYALTPLELDEDSTKRFKYVCEHSYMMNYIAHK